MKNKNITKIGLIYFTSITLVAIVFVLGSFGIVTNDFLSAFLIQCVVLFGIPLLLYSLLVSKNFKQTFIDCGFKKINAKMILISVLLGVVLFGINSFVASTFSSIISLFGYEQVKLGNSSTETLSYLTLLKELVLSCLLPAICEEFLHRGIMLHANKKYTNPRFALIISSILFGLIHLNINQFFYACILGLFIGYVALVSDSIFPSMIIHFMNNALSTYFYYGSYMKWPLATFVNNLEALIANNIILFVVFVSFSVLLLFICYKYLTKSLAQERAKMDISKIVAYLNSNKLTIEQAQEKINQINIILKQSYNLHKPRKQKHCFMNYVFIISSIVLGSLITISSFIWGLI